MSKTTQTNGSGFFPVGEVQPEAYTVIVDASGFQSSTNTDIQVAAEPLRGVNVQLKTGEATQGRMSFNPQPVIPAIGRNSFGGPNYRSIDLSLAKNFRFDSFGFSEGSMLQLQVNAYNIFNLLSLMPFNLGDANTSINDLTFDRPESAEAGRTIELQARFRL